MAEPGPNDAAPVRAPSAGATGVLQELAQAFLALEHSYALYPDGHQARDAPLARLLELLRSETGAGGSGSLGVAGAALLWRGVLHEDLPAPSRKLPALLGGRGITRLIWSKELTVEELGRFFELLVRGRAAGHRQNWEAREGFAQLQVEGPDYQALMAPAGATGAAAGRRDLWKALLQRTLADPSTGLAAPEIALLQGDWGDPAALALQLAGAIGPGAETGETAAVEAVRRFAALSARAAPPGERPPGGSVLEKLSAVVRQLPPNLRLRLLEAALGEPAQSGLSRACGLPGPAEGIALLGRTFKLDALQIERLTRVFQHLVPRRLERMELAPQLREQIRQAADPGEPLADNAWEEVQGLLTGEAGDFMSPEYRRQLHRLTERTQARADAEASLSALVGLAEDLAPEVTAAESLRIQLEELRLATSVERYRDALEGLGGLCAALLAAGDMEHGVWILRHLLDANSGDEPLAGPRAELERTVRALPGKPLLQTIVPLVPSLSAADQATVRELFSMAGEVAAAVLLDALESAEDSERRRELALLLQDLGSAALPELLRRLAAATPAVARTLLPLIAGRGDPAAAPVLLGLLGRGDQKLRREVLQALLRLDSPEVRRALPRLLKDRDEEIVQMAAAHLGAVGSPETVRELLRALDVGLFAGRRAREIRRAIVALGRMRAGEAVGPLSGLLRRRVWLNRRTREELGVAAAQALGRIGGTAARQALEDCAARGPGSLAETCRRLLERWESG